MNNLHNPEIKKQMLQVPLSSIKDIIFEQKALLNNVKESLDNQQFIITTTGVLDFNFQTIDSPYPTYYNVPLKDTYNSTDVIGLDIPKQLVQRNRLVGSEVVTINGYLRMNAYNNQFTVRISVIGLKLNDDNQLLNESNKSFATFFKNLNIRKKGFPLFQKLNIAIIHPQSGDSYTDFIQQVDGSSVDIRQYPINMLSKDTLLKSLSLISSANFNVLIIIRGGGQSSEFNIFDDIDVCEKFASIECHKILGVGHSSNRTLLDIIADNVFQTPTAVGSFINQKLQEMLEIKESFIEAETENTAAIKAELNYKLNTRNKTIIAMASIIVILISIIILK